MSRADRIAVCVALYIAIACMVFYAVCPPLGYGGDDLGAILDALFSAILWPVFGLWILQR